MNNIFFIFIFLPIFLLIYYILPNKYKNIVIILGSLILLYLLSFKLMVIILLSSLINYIISLYLEKKHGLTKKIIFISSIFLNMIILIITKIFIGNSLIYFVLYTLSVIGYMIDCFCKDIKVEHKFSNYFLYLIMFPKLFYGPIVKYEIIKLDLKTKKLIFKDISEGFLKTIRGLFKVVFISGQMGYLFDILNNNINISILSTWFSILAYILKIYYFLSGYSDIAVGLGRMLGFNYDDNFNYPFISKSMTDFLQRFNISITNYFNEYIYKKIKLSKIIKILLMSITMCLVFKYKINYFILGISLGFILIIEKYLLSKYKNYIPSIIKHIYLLFIIIIFFTLTFDNSLEIFNNMFGISNIPFINSSFIYYLKNYFLIMVLAIIFSMPVYPRIKQLLKNFKYPRLLFIISLIMYLLLFIIITSYLISNYYTVSL